MITKTNQMYKLVNALYSSAPPFAFFQKYTFDALYNITDKNLHPKLASRLFNLAAPAFRNRDTLMNVTSFSIPDVPWGCTTVAFVTKIGSSIAHEAVQRRVKVTFDDGSVKEGINFTLGRNRFVNFTTFEYIDRPDERIRHSGSRLIFESVPLSVFRRLEKFNRSRTTNADIMATISSRYADSMRSRRFCYTVTPDKLYMSLTSTYSVTPATGESFGKIYVFKRPSVSLPFEFIGSIEPRYANADNPLRDCLNGRFIDTSEYYKRLNNTRELITKIIKTYNV